MAALNASQKEMNVTSNNLANASTVGFKRSYANFGDVFSNDPASNPKTAVGAGGPEGGFSVASLSGSYASSGKADGFLSRSIGVTTFDGKGGVKRFVSINARDGSGRKIILLTSVGTYTIDSSGLGTIFLENTLAGGVKTLVTYDFVIAKSSRGGTKGALQADEVTGIQREAGITASLVEEYWTRREGL